MRELEACLPSCKVCWFSIDFDGVKGQITTFFRVSLRWNGQWPITHAGYNTGKDEQNSSFHREHSGTIFRCEVSSKKDYNDFFGSEH